MGQGGIVMRWGRNKGRLKNRDATWGRDRKMPCSVSDFDGFFFAL